MGYTIGYLIGVAIKDIVYVIPVYIAVSMAMKKVVRHKNLKIFGVCFAIISVSMSVAEGFTYGDIIMIPVDLVLCMWLGNKHYFDMHKPKSHKS